MRIAASTCCLLLAIAMSATAATPKLVVATGDLRNPLDLANDAGATQSWFGFSLAVSANTAVVGAPKADTAAGVDAGIAYVYVNDGSAWSLQATLVAPDAAAGDWFGYSAAIAGDRILVGCNKTDGINSNGCSKVYAFERTGTTWSAKPAIAFPGTQLFSYFGESIAMDGNTAVIGAPNTQWQPPTFSGSAYVYVHAGGAWTLQQKIGPSDNDQGQRFGTSIDIDGDTVVVGAPRHLQDGAPVGRAWVYRRTGTTWSETGPILPSDGAPNDQFGFDVAVSATSVVVGAPFHASSGISGSGAVYSYAGSNGSYSPFPTGAPSTSAVANAVFGWAVELDGDWLWAGKPGSQLVQAFKRSGNGWISRESIQPTFGNFFPGYFGKRIAATATTLLVGAPDAGSDVSASRGGVGRAHTFRRSVQVSVNAGANGSVSPSGSFAAPLGQSVDFVLTPDVGYRIAAAAGCGGALSGTTFRTAALDENCGVLFAFANDPPVIESLAATSTTFYEGESTTLTITASDDGAALRGVPAIQYAFDCDGDGTFEVGPQAANATSCRIFHAGNYTLAGRAIDRAGAIDTESVAVAAEASVPSVTIVVGGAVDEDASYTVTVGASVPSSGESIFSVEIDCDFDTGVFAADEIVAGPGDFTCPGFATGGTHYTATRVSDNEDDTVSTSTAVTVNAINDAPSFTIAGDLSEGPGATGARTRTGFVTGVVFGPEDESAQAVLQYAVTEVADASDVVSAIALANNGTLTYTLSGRGGTASFSIVLTDNGGTPGQPQSQPVAFTITNAPGTDLRVTVDNAQQGVVAGASVRYVVVVTNAGPNAVNAAQFADMAPVGLDGVAWTCTATGAAACPQASGNDSIAALLDMGVGATVRYDMTGSVNAIVGAFLENTATIAAPAGMAELDDANNSATDTDAVLAVGILRDGFE